MDYVIGVALAAVAIVLVLGCSICCVAAAPTHRKG